MISSRLKTKLVAALLAGAAFPFVPTTLVQGAPLPPLKSGDWASLTYKWTAAGSTATGTPVGNGHIGARIAGGVGVETLALNDKWFFSGGPGMTPDNPARRTAMLNTRAKLAAGDIPGADTAAKGMWGSNNLGTYLPLGNLTIDFAHGNTATNYSRVLDLGRSVTTVSYTVAGVNYTRETFASFPDDVIVMRISASAAGRISFTTKLTYPTQMEGHGGSVANAAGNVIVMKGKAPANSGWDANKGMNTECRVKVIAQGGSVSSSGGSVTVSNADSAILIVANETSYNGFDKEPGTQGVNPSPLVQATLAAAAAKSYNNLLADHVADYQALSHRLWVEINGSATEPRALGFQYARYEMISVSRNGDRPHNQQGMWNDSWTPTSNSAHWLNENVEKYYSLIEAANLSECGEPLWNWMNELSINGARTASIDWGFHGWTAGQSSDIWARTALASGNNEWAIWPMGGVWLCENLWDHYAFTQDKAFLQNRAYPILKGAAEFCLDYLVDDGHGHLVTSPSTSPENRFGLTDGGTPYAVSRGSTMDMALVRAVFQHVIEASTILNVDTTFRNTLQTTLPKLLPFQISPSGSAKGELQEWSENYSRLPSDPGNRYTPHRHASHVVSVWPLAQITERSSPALFAAAKLALINRGSGGYHPDKGAMFARLHDGDRALGSGDSMPTGLGAIQSKFPPKYAAFAEMLVQSHTDAIELLPALPTSWTSGKVSGLRARGDYELSIEWSGSQLTKCQIDSHRGTTPTVRYKGVILDLKNDARITLTGTGTNTGGGTVVAQAEDGTWSAGSGTETVNTGWTGTGYVNTANAAGAFVEVMVNVAAAGPHTLDFRFANGTTADRRADISINGVVVQAAASFPGTGAWTTWSDVVITKNLNAGNNTIRLTATTANGCANLDKVTVQ